MTEHRHDENCKEIASLLSEYLDAELPPDLCGQIEAHISGCPPCVEFVESLRKSIELCRRRRLEATPGPLPAEAREELMAAYRRMLESRRSS